MKKVTIMIILVTLNFAIGWLPTHLFIIIRRIRTIDPNTNEYVYLQVFKIVAHTLSYLTPVVNVCLYAFFNENFQKPLKEIYLKAFCKYDKQTRLVFNAQTNGEPFQKNRSGSLKTAVQLYFQTSKSFEFYNMGFLNRSFKKLQEYYRT